MSDTNDHLIIVTERIITLKLCEDRGETTNHNRGESKLSLDEGGTKIHIGSSEGKTTTKQQHNWRRALRALGALVTELRRLSGERQWCGSQAKASGASSNRAKTVIEG